MSSNVNSFLEYPGELKRTTGYLPISHPPTYLRTYVCTILTISYSSTYNSLQPTPSSVRINILYVNITEIVTKFFHSSATEREFGAVFSFFAVNFCTEILGQQV